jgi:hypothetical protein
MLNKTVMMLKTILPRMWSADHIENYINFTNPPQFKINPDYPYENDLANGIDVNQLTEEDYNKAIAQLKNEVQNYIKFRQAYAQKQIDDSGYVKFLKSYAEYHHRKPTTVDNLSFMVEYQFIYVLEVLNVELVGRQNDNQGRYGTQDGNWISGVKFIDELVGSQDNLPADILNNKGRNVYFFLPFLLGLIGLMYHATKNMKSFTYY